MMTREDKSERQALLRASGEHEARRLSTVGIGIRWTPKAIERRDTAAGSFEQINPREQSLDADVIQRALLCRVPPRGNGRIRSVLLCIALFGGMAVAIFQPWR